MKLILDLPDIEALTRIDAVELAKILRSAFQKKVTCVPDSSAIFNAKNWRILILNSGQVSVSGKSIVITSPDFNDEWIDFNSTECDFPHCKHLTDEALSERISSKVGYDII